MDETEVEVEVPLNETTPNAVVDQVEEEPDDELEQPSHPHADFPTGPTINIKGEPIPEQTIREVLEEHKNDQYFDSLWCGIPNYKCPFCPHKSLGGPAAIDAHIYDYHPEDTTLDFGESIGDEDDE